MPSKSRFLEGWPLPYGASLLLDHTVLRASDNERHSIFFRQLTRDGVEINGEIYNEDNIPSFEIKLPDANSQSISNHSIWLFPKAEQFILLYLLTGKDTEFPANPKNNILPDFRAEDDYIDRHIKRELERGKYTYTEEIQDGVSGIHFTGLYPYGSINYGFMPCSWEELNAKMEDVEAFLYIYPEHDIPELHSNTLPIEINKLAKKEHHLDSVFKDKRIPTNAIIDKTICGVGATWLEIHSDRNSIIIEPNVPVIIGKMQQHPNIIGVFGEKIKEKDIANKIEEQTGKIKIMTTPDSYMKVANALTSLRIPYRDDYFMLFDECEKIVSDIDFRRNIALPIDDFFKFKNKAMVSATPIVVNDPRFEAQQFKIIKIEPQFEYKQLLELKPTNNVDVMVKRTVSKIGEDSVICFFFNSIKGIEELIELLGIVEQSNIYCSSEAKKELKKSGYNVFDSVSDDTGKTVLNKYNFFTSRFYSAVDITLDYKPIVIMVTQVYKTMPNKTPYSLIDPETEAIQIAGRFRNGIDRLIHITNTNANTAVVTREELEKSLKEQHTGFLKMLDLYKSVDEDGEKLIITQAVTRTDYWAQGFVNYKGKVNYFRYNNAYLDERLKMLYTYPAPLLKAYKRSGAFTIISDSEYAIYTDEERRKLKDTNTLKSKRLTLLYEIISRLNDSDQKYDTQFAKELKEEFPLYYEAYMTIGFQKVKALEFKDSDVRAEVKRVKKLQQATKKEVVDAVYRVFQPNTLYSTQFINEHLIPIFQQYNVDHNANGVAKDIQFYFTATATRTGQERGWRLAEKTHN